MKKLMVILLCLTILASGLAGCGKPSSSEAVPSAASYSWVIQPTLEYDMLSSLFEVPREKDFHYLNATGTNGTTIIVFETGEEVYPPTHDFSFFICFLGELNYGGGADSDVVGEIANKMGYPICGGHGGGFEGQGDTFFVNNTKENSFGGYYEYFNGELDYDMLAKEAFPYYKIEKYYDGYIDEKQVFVKDSDKFGFATAEGELLTPTIYDGYNRFRDNGNGTVLVEAENKYGYFSLYEGKVVADCIYDPLYAVDEEQYFVSNIGFFNEGLCPVNQNGKYGYINLDGQEVVPLEFEGATHVLNGKAWVKQGGLWGQIAIPAASKSANTEQETKFSIKDALPEDVTPSEEIVGYYIVDADGGLRLRSKAGASQPALELIPDEEHVRAYGYITIEENGVSEKWYYVDYNGQLGYVHSEYLVAIK